MKFLSFQATGKKYQGILDEDKVLELEGNIFEDYHVTKRIHALEDIKILPPCNPGKIVAIGLNYKDHAEEMNKKIPDFPILFMKPATAVIAHEEYIVLPEMSKRVDYEAELAVVIGKKCKGIQVNEAHEYIFGGTCLNDVTARDLQSLDGQWTRAKSFDTFAPVGPWIETDLEFDNLDVQLILNGEIRQHSNTSNLIAGIHKLVSFISNVMTLHPGDIIATGTPSGIGELHRGDVVEVKVEGIGILRNYIK